MGKKRTAEQTTSSTNKVALVHGENNQPKPHAQVEMNGDESEGMGEFEDAWEDEIESDGEIIDGADEEDEDGVVDMEIGDDQEKEPAAPKIKVYLPGQKLEEGEELVHDASAYHMLHTMSSRWPCLSFDILPDRLGSERSTYPHTVYSVAGTQADQPDKNELYVMKMSQLNKTMHDDGDSDSDSDDGMDDDPILEHRTIPHYGGINRIRITTHAEGSTVAATWADTGKVQLWDLRAQMTALDVPGTVVPHEATRPIYTIENHGNVEGFAMDWSKLSTGRLLTGDLSGRIFLTTRGQAGYTTTPEPFTGHTSSVEDIQFSPTEKTVFASCSADGTIRIWDTRSAKRKPVIGIQGSQTDLNVISWNQKVAFFIASGSDDGEIAVWDIRKFEKKEMSTCTPVATFRWHNAPVTAIEWSPHEESVLAAAGADDQVSIWDLSVEADTEERGEEEEEEVPPQLLFVHQGQKDIKDLHWHKNIPGVMMTTAATGFNVFKPMNF